MVISVYECVISVSYVCYKYVMSGYSGVISLL